MANINYQRKGLRISIAVFGPGAAEAVSVLESIRSSCDPAPEATTVKENGGEVRSFFAPIEPGKPEGIDLTARFLSASDTTGDWRVWNSLLRQADGVVFLTGKKAGSEEENARAWTILDSLFPVRASDSAVVLLCKGEEDGDAGRLGGTLHASGMPLFISKGGDGAALNAVATVLKSAASRSQRQFELMGGQGLLGERIKLRVAGGAARPAGAEKPSTGQGPGAICEEPQAPRENQALQDAPSPELSETPAPADVRVECEPVKPVETLLAEPPATDTGGGGTGMAQMTVSGQEVAELTESMKSAAAVVAKVPALCEAIAHVAVAVRMIHTRVEGLEKAADDIPRVEFGVEAAERIGALLSDAGHAVDVLSGEKERLISLLGESDEAREAEARKHEGLMAEAAADQERLTGELEALKKEIERLNGSLSEAEGRIANLNADLQGEKAGREADAARHAAELAAARDENAILDEKAVGAAAAAAEAHKEVEVLKVAVEGLEHQLGAAREEAATVKAHAERHAGEAQDMSAKLSDTERELKENAALLEKARAEAAELRSTLDGAQNTVNSFREQVMAEQARAAAAREAEQRAHADFRALQSEVEGLKNGCDTARKAAEDSKREASEALEQMKVLEAETRALRHETSKKDAHIRNLAEEISRKDADIASLKGSIGEMAAKFQEAASLATLQGVHVRPSTPPTPYPPVSAARRGPVLPPNVPLPQKRVTQKYGSPQTDAHKPAVPAGQAEEPKKEEEDKT